MKDTQNSKRNNDLSPEQISRRGCLTFLLAIIAIGMIGTSVYRDNKKASKTIASARAAIAQNDEKRAAYVAGDDIRNNEMARARRDSLNAVNWQLYNVAAEKYFDRIDKKYTLSRFFNSRDIAELNRILAPYLDNMAGDSSFEYKYIKSNMPLRSDTKFGTFLDIIGVMRVSGESLEKFGMVAEDGYLYAFNDQRRLDLIDSFAGDYDAGVMGDQGPNFNIPEFAKIQKEYTRNARQIDSINRVVERGDSVIKAKLQEYDSIRAKLNQDIDIAKRKLSY